MQKLLFLQPYEFDFVRQASLHVVAQFALEVVKRWEVVDEKNLLEEHRRRGVEHAVNRSKNDRVRLFVEDDDDTGGGQAGDVMRRHPAKAVTDVGRCSVVANPIAEQHIDSVCRVTFFSQSLIVAA